MVAITSNVVMAYGASWLGANTGALVRDYIGVGGVSYGFQPLSFVVMLAAVPGLGGMYLPSDLLPFDIPGKQYIFSALIGLISLTMFTKLWVNLYVFLQQTIPIFPNPALKPLDPTLK